jgi:hypothetical protein
MNIQKFKSAYKLVATKVELIRDIEKENQPVYKAIVQTVIDGLCISDEDEKKAIIGSLQDTSDSLITGSIQNLKMLIEACDIQNKKLVELKKENLTESQKTAVENLHHTIEGISLDLQTILTFSLEKLDLVNELLKMESMSGDRVDALIIQLHKELKGIE